MVRFYYRYTQFGGPVHRRPVEDIAFSVARFIQNNGSFVNYYMVSQFFHFVVTIQRFVIFPKKVLTPFTCIWWLQYHGGTNFGRTAAALFIATSYDYDAPLDEYGMIFQEQAISSM